MPVKRELETPTFIRESRPPDALSQTVPVQKTWYHSQNTVGIFKENHHLNPIVEQLHSSWLQLQHR